MNHYGGWVNCADFSRREKLQKCQNLKQADESAQVLKAENLTICVSVGLAMQTSIIHLKKVQLVLD